MRGSQALALARATARRLARVAARAAVAPEDDGCTSGSRAGVEETTTRTLVPVRRAATRLPSTRIRESTRGVAGSDTSTSARTVAGSDGNGAMPVVSAIAQGESPNTRGPVSPITSRRSPSSRRPVGAMPSKPMEPRFRGAAPVTSVACRRPPAMLKMVRPSVSTRSGSSTPASWRLVSEKSTPRWAPPVAGAATPSRSASGGGLTPMEQRGAQPVGADHADRPAAHVAEEPLARGEPGQGRLGRAGRRGARRGRGSVVGGGRAPSAGQADRRERTHRTSHEQTSAHHAPPPPGRRASRGRSRIIRRRAPSRHIRHRAPADNGPAAGYIRRMEWALLAGIPEADVQRLLSIARRRTFRRGEVVFHMGDPADTLHLIASGRFAVRVQTALADVAILTVLGPGQLFGELALLEPDAHRSATVEALEPGETRSVHRPDFEELRRRHPQVSDVLVAILAGQVQRLSRQLLEALYMPADTRVLRRRVRARRALRTRRRRGHRSRCARRISPGWRAPPGPRSTGCCARRRGGEPCGWGAGAWWWSTGRHSRAALRPPVTSGARGPARRRCAAPCTFTNRLSRKSRTRTVPSVTRMTVRSQPSMIVHCVPRAMAEA